MARIFPFEIRNRYLGFPMPSAPRHQPPSTLYVLDSLGLIKIGVTTRLEWRLSTIRAMNPHDVRLIAKFDVCRQFALQIERRVHDAFADRRISGEWFRDVSVEEIETPLALARRDAATAMARYEADGHFNPHHACSAYARKRAASPPS